jgi:hypothetical protein
LISTNQTTWEHASGFKLDYIKIYRKGVYPFDLGIINNLKTIFCHGNKIK